MLTTLTKLLIIFSDLAAIMACSIRSRRRSGASKKKSRASEEKLKEKVRLANEKIRISDEKFGSRNGK
ncbi:hypothetical protein Hanom_Chr09g00831541 [Helianthus anomalus]